MLKQQGFILSEKTCSPVSGLMRLVFSLLVLWSDADFSLFLPQLAKNVGNSSFNEIMEGNLPSPSPKPTPLSDM